MADIPKLTIQVSKTADGQKEYTQIMSEDMLTVNVVFVTQEVIIRDDR